MEVFEVERSGMIWLISSPIRLTKCKYLLYEIKPLSKSTYLPIQVGEGTKWVALDGHA